jgi:cysteine desulfurase/selenocysteine lyase
VSSSSPSRLAVDWAAVRSDFPILAQQVRGQPLIYFDNAASSQKPRAVLGALRHYYERDNANVHRGLHELSSRATEAYEAARVQLAAYLGAAAPEEIVFTRGTTEGINLVAQSWGVKFLRAGDAVLLTEMEHHSNLVPWQLLAERLDLQLRFVPIDSEGRLDLTTLDALLAGAKLFAFTHVSNSLGTINPAAELCRRAREAGVVTLVDGAQSAGHLPVNVRDLGCDFYVFSGHKICGPTGIGALYGRAELLDAMPPWHGGGEMILSVKYERSTFKPPPQRFEAGTPNIAGAIGLATATRYLDSIGRDAIFAHDLALTQRAIAGLEKLPGVRIFGPRSGERGSLVGFVMESAHPHDLTTYANQYGLALRGGHHCNQPLMRKLGVPGTTRASFYFYNTEAEVDRALEILAAAQRFFG